MITYSDLYEALRKEKYNEKLQKLSKNFLAQIESYFNEKKSMASKDEDDSLFGEEVTKTKKQIENARSIVRELLMLRQKKILGLALVAAKIGIDKRDIENMLDFEKELLEETTAKLEKHKNELEAIFRGVQKKDLKNQLIRFTQDIPPFLIENGHIGPFKKGDVANLPREIAGILTKNKQAESIQEK